MIEKNIIDEVKNRLVKTYDPLAIYLFGSYSWGSPTDESNLDLLIIINESTERDYTRAVSGHKALIGLGIAKDLIVQTKDEFEKKHRIKPLYITK